MQAAPAAPTLLELHGVHWPLLVAATIFSGVAAMSVHVVMFDVLLVPHPEITSVPHAAIFANDALSLIATIWLCRLLQPELLGISFFWRCLLVAALYAMLGEALFRSFLMDGVVSNAWRFSFIENLTRPSEALVSCSLVVLVAPHLRRRWQVVVAGIAIAALAALVINPLLSGALDRLTASFEYLDTGNIYNPPYGWQVNVPSYLTFAEPVFACLLIAATAWRKLAGPLIARLALFTLTIMAIKGAIMPTLVYSFFQNLPLPRAIASESQFGLEILVLAMLSALSWHFSAPRDRQLKRSEQRPRRVA